MNTIRLIVAAIVFLAVPAALPAQTWSPEEQELLDHLVSIWDQVEENNEANFSLWQDVVHPRDDLIWWFTDQGAPYDLDAVRKWHQGWETRNSDYTYLNVRPVAVRIIDSVGMVWFRSYGEVKEPEGERSQWEDIRLEIFHKTPDGWEFVGGMVTLVVPAEADGD